MTERLLLDTDVLVEYLRGRPRAVKYLERLKNELWISTITSAELFAGARDEAECAVLDRFLMAFSIMPVSEDAARMGGTYKNRWSKSHGTGLADALIAASAEMLNARLITFNLRHYPMVEKKRRPY